MRSPLWDFPPGPIGMRRGAPVCAPVVGRTAGRHAGRPLPGEMGAALFRICHCEERRDAAIRVPLCAMRNAEKGERIPTAACGRLGMTGSGEWRIV